MGDRFALVLKVVWKCFGWKRLSVVKPVRFWVSEAAPPEEIGRTPPAANLRIPACSARSRATFGTVAYPQREDGSRASGVRGPTDPFGRNTIRHCSNR